VPLGHASPSAAWLGVLLSSANHWAESTGSTIRGVYVSHNDTIPSDGVTLALVSGLFRLGHSSVVMAKLSPSLDTTLDRVEGEDDSVMVFGLRRVTERSGASLVEDAGTVALSARSLRERTGPVKDLSDKLEHAGSGVDV
jgi:hypothetical protein